tara:strand:- start:12153 stop:12719 length:567 start_codon:yes stop_codon:yes gene_type:complete
MSRQQANDHLQSFRFHAGIIGVPEESALTNEQWEQQRLSPTRGTAQAGFQSISSPELSVDPVEYREGIDTYTKKYPGPPTVTDCSLQQGVVLGDSAFMEWVLAAVDGREYRADIAVWFYHRSVQLGEGASPVAPTEEGQGMVLSMFNAFPTRVKPLGDLDSTSGEVSLSELDLVLEHFSVRESGSDPA